VRAEAQGGGLGQINAEGLQKEGEAYVNDASGDSEVTLEPRGSLGELLAGRDLFAYTLADP